MLCGFVDDKTLPWLGASPDFLIHDSTVHTPSEITQQMRLVMTRIFFLSKVDGKVLLKQNHSYYYQVQGCLIAWPHLCSSGRILLFLQKRTCILKEFTLTRNFGRKPCYHSYQSFTLSICFKNKYVIKVSKHAEL